MTETLASCSVGSESPLGTLSTFAAVFLFVNLAAMTGVRASSVDQSNQY